MTEDRGQTTDTRPEKMDDGRRPARRSLPAYGGAEGDQGLGEGGRAD